MFRKFILLTSVPLLLATNAMAADRPASAVTIDELVTQALTDNPELGFYEAEISAAKGERSNAGTRANPEFSGEIGQKRTRSSGLSAEGVAWSISVTQAFEWPGRVALRKAIADRQVSLANIGLEQFRASLAAQVRQKALALFSAQKRESAAREVAGRGEELVATLVQREPAGVTPLLETRAIEASVIKMRRQAIEATRESTTALYELNALRGRPIAEALTITNAEISFPEMPTITELMHRAGRNNFELKQREMELVQQGFRLRLAANEAWPTVTVGPRVAQEAAGNEKETLASLSVSVPLPLWNRNQGGIQTANARLAQAEASLKVTLRGLERKLRENATAYQQLRSELTRLNPQATEQFREAAMLADRHYRLGAVPLTTYLEVQQSYLEALQAIYSTQMEALSARAEIDLLTGTSIPPGLRTPLRETPVIAPVSNKKSHK